MRVLNEDESNNIWSEIYNKFHFVPSINKSTIPFLIDIPHKIYTLEKCWSESQEKIVKDILILTGISEAYALDWQHSNFLFSPYEEIPYGLNWYDFENGYQIYFPSFYPDGDYHFFVNGYLSEGFLGHPWRKEIWVIGEKSILAFEKYKFELNLY